MYAGYVLAVLFSSSDFNSHDVLDVIASSTKGPDQFMADTKLKVGDAAPDFDLLSDQGTRIKLSDQRGKRVVLFFYPKDDTPGCTRQACGLRDNYASFEQKNAVV